MEKFIKTFMFLFIFCNTSFAETYYFKQCKLSNIASGDYIIDLKKKTIETNLQTTDGRTQRFFDKIKIIENDQIITEKIPSGKGDEIYFEYYLNLKNNSVIKLQYKKQSGLDLDIYKIQEQKVSKCLDVKGGWDKDEIEKVEIDKEQEQIEKAQKKNKKRTKLDSKMCR